jgi:hypothetical protein
LSGSMRRRPWGPGPVLTRLPPTNPEPAMAVALGT